MWNSLNWFFVEKEAHKSLLFNFDMNGISFGMEKKQSYSQTSLLRKIERTELVFQCQELLNVSSIILEDLSE